MDIFFLLLRFIFLVLLNLGDKYVFVQKASSRLRGVVSSIWFKSDISFNSMEKKLLHTVG